MLTIHLDEFPQVLHDTVANRLWVIISCFPSGFKNVHKTKGLDSAQTSGPSNENEEFLSLEIQHVTAEVKHQWSGGTKNNYVRCVLGQERLLSEIFPCSETVIVRY